MKTTKCIKCGTIIEYEPLAMAPNLCPTICDSCDSFSCDDNSEDIYQELFRRSNISITYDQLKNFKLDKYPFQQKIVDYFNKTVNKKTKRLPYIFGTPGNGKTHLGLMLCSKIIFTYNMNVVFYNIPSTIYNQRKSDDKLKLKTSFMVLDDLGAHNVTNWTLELLYHIVDTRITLDLPTLITSNINPFNLSAYLQSCNRAVSSKLCDALMDRVFQLNFPMELKGKSIRLENCTRKTN